MVKIQMDAFAFSKHNISSKTLYLLKHVDSCYQIFPNNIDRYLEMLLHEQPVNILGLGIYTGRDSDKIRIETKCSNRYRNGFVDGDRFNKMDMNPYLQPLLNSKFAEGIGTSQCNLMSWKIMSLIRDGKLKSGYTFLHIPKKFGVHSAVQEIDRMLDLFKSGGQEKGVN